MSGWLLLSRMDKAPEFREISFKRNETCYLVRVQAKDDSNLKLCYSATSGDAILVSKLLQKRTHITGFKRELANKGEMKVRLMFDIAWP